ncbi:PstS family phosphate ABC transporter substrate-binding protein [Candidatus Woesearchaeota archaeon]|nr:PstS family phosphate ABC transporter substrate-binding protein [Candidatus Woesearchaeota archaeon]
MKEIIKKINWIFIVVILVAVLLAGCAGKNAVTGNVVKEQKSQVENIEIKGSDTLLQMVSNMAEAYRTSSPEVRISVTGGGSGAGIAALINGEIPIADASRPIKSEELKQAADKGMQVQEFAIARDMLSVIVNKDNPVEKLTMEQLSKIFKGEITSWKELGDVDKQISLYGRQSTSGTYAFFMEHVVQADYSPKMMNMEGNQAIIDAVKHDKSGIGYVGIGYLLDEAGKPIQGVRIVPVASDENSEYISPLDQSKIEEYPVSRVLFQYFANPPAKGSELHKFLLFELSEQGQRIVEKSGYIRLLPGDKQKNDALLAKI